MKCTHICLSFCMLLVLAARTQGLLAQGAIGTEDSDSVDSAERTLVPEADVVIPADAWSDSYGVKSDQGEGAKNDAVREQDPDNVDIPPADRATAAEIDCKTFASGTSEDIMEAIVMAEAGSDGNFCRVAPGETCSDFDDQLKGYGSLKSSAQSPLFCKFVGHGN